jgi:type III pantothenate kinase
MNIAIDYGNSSAKVGLFEGRELVEHHIFASPDELRDYLQNYSGECLIISSVSMDAAEVSTWAKHVKTRFILNSSLPLPIKNRYATPETLGVDRIAGACGAQSLFPGTPSLVIDAGTCITWMAMEIFLGEAFRRGYACDSRPFTRLPSGCRWSHRPKVPL